MWQKYLGRLPTVRFGSTETCLQVMGIPLSLPTDAQLEAFKKGWEAPDQPGFYIGRPHPPFTEVHAPLQSVYVMSAEAAGSKMCVSGGCR